MCLQVQRRLLSEFVGYLKGVVEEGQSVSQLLRVSPALHHPRAPPPAHGGPAPPPHGLAPPISVSRAMGVSLGVCSNGMVQQRKGMPARLRY